MLSSIIYTDGSARPNPGNAGWGIHGYIYDTDKKSKKPKQFEKKYITNIGYVDEITDKVIPVEPILYINGYGSFDHSEYDSTMQTSALAEIYAIKIALEVINEKDIKHTLLMSDSEYAIYIAKDVEKIAKRNFLKSTGERYTHETIIRDIYEQYKLMVNNNRTIEFKWVKGHSGILGNEIADKSAYVGMKRSSEKDYSPLMSKIMFNKTPTTSPFTKSPLISLPRIYYFSKPSFDDVGVYYMTGYPYTGKDDYVLGKRTSDAIFSLTTLTQPDTLLESVKELHRKISGDYNKIIMLDVDNLYTASNISDYGLYGSYSMIPERKNGVSSMTSMDKGLISVDQVPPNLAYKAIQVFQELTEIYVDCFKHILEPESNKLPPNLEIFEITDSLYVSDKKVQLIKSLDNNTPIKVPGIGVFKFKLDLPSKEVFKKIENESPRVFVGQSKYADIVQMRFSIIKCKLGAQIYTNRYAYKVSDVMSIKMR